MINNVDNFVEETLIISTMWKATWDIFHNKVSTCQKCQKSRIICYAKNVENPATFAEGFWPEFQARGRFMNYSMSASQKLYALKMNGRI